MGEKRMATITVSLPEPLHAFVQAKAAADGHGDASAYVRGLIAEAQQASLRVEMEAKLLVGVEALDQGQGRELTAADWENLRKKYR
jgi:Arc/MetJ-type ribon-helix-helix transcriptional regulator